MLTRSREGNHTSSFEDAGEPVIVASLRGHTRKGRALIDDAYRGRLTGQQGGGK